MSLIIPLSHFPIIRTSTRNPQDKNNNNNDDDAKCPYFPQLVKSIHSSAISRSLTMRNKYEMNKKNHWNAKKKKWSTFHIKYDSKMLLSGTLVRFFVPLTFKIQDMEETMTCLNNNLCVCVKQKISKQIKLKEEDEGDKTNQFITFNLLLLSISHVFFLHTYIYYLFKFFCIFVHFPHYSWKNKEKQTEDEEETLQILILRRFSEEDEWTNWKIEMEMKYELFLIFTHSSDDDERLIWC